jgi:murein L,D-transpeptidase YafK
MKKIVIILLLLPSLAFGLEKADSVLVVKSKSKLYLMKAGKVLKAYQVALGANPKGHKTKMGDERTPEGRYVLDYKKSDSAFYKAIHISYPNEADKRKAKKLGVNPGGFIMIHGQKNRFGGLWWLTQRFNWTEGCVAVSNREMDEIWQAVDVGTPIEIKP